MILVFTGCRDGRVGPPVIEYLVSKYAPTEVRVGDATGVDQCVRDYFAGDSILKVYEADWDTHGKSAGPIRNRAMVQGADQVLAFWDGDSPGTLDCVKQATRKRVPSEIVPL